MFSTSPLPVDKDHHQPPSNPASATDTRYYHKKLNNISYSFHQQNLKTNIFIKQTKTDIQKVSTPIVATSVFNAVT